MKLGILEYISAKTSSEVDKRPIAEAVDVVKTSKNIIASKKACFTTITSLVFSCLFQVFIQTTVSRRLPKQTKQKTVVPFEPMIESFSVNFAIYALQKNFSTVCRFIRIELKIYSGNFS